MHLFEMKVGNDFSLPSGSGLFYAQTVFNMMNDGKKTENG